MSLFLRIWLMVTVVMTLAVLAGVAAYKIGVDRDHARDQRADALATAQLVAQGVAGALDDHGAWDAAEAADRVRRLMHTGQFLALAVVDQTGGRLVSAALPGLERLGSPVPAAGAVLETLVPALSVDAAAVHVLHPLFDGTGVPRGVVTVSLPRDTATLGTADRVVFAVVAVAVVLGLAFAASAMLARRISGPINAMSAVADGLERGAFDTRTVSALIGRRDEIGKLARTVLRLTRALDHVSARMDALVDERLKERAPKADAPR